MQAEPMLSFGVPVRSGARFLRRLLTSVEAQDFDYFEVVLEPTSARRCVEANPDAVGVTTLWRYVDDEVNQVLLNDSGIRVDSKSVQRRISRMLWCLQADFGADPIYSALRSSMLKGTGLLPIGPWTDRVPALELAIDGPFCQVHHRRATRRNAREPAKVRLARHHSAIKEVEHATEVRLAPRWAMYRGLAKVVINSFLEPADRVLGTTLVISFGGLHHARALGERALKLVGQGQAAATTA